MYLNLKWVLATEFSKMTGYTPKAICRKIEDGVWPQGVIWRNSPDGRRQINLEEYNKWVEENPLV
ncbi:MAG: hypothetical protein ACR2PT_03150 [Endozoicomonas sp.]